LLVLELTVFRRGRGLFFFASFFFLGFGFANISMSLAFRTARFAASLLSFSEALRQELAPRGVRVTILCPGSVSAEFQARAGIKPGFEHAILNVSASDVARAGYRGLMANKRVVLPGLGIKIVPFLLRLFPRGFILAAVGRLQLRKRR
jgi:short-subunit dehydrogenase